MGLLLANLYNTSYYHRLESSASIPCTMRNIDSFGYHLQHVQLCLVASANSSGAVIPYHSSHGNCGLVKLLGVSQAFSLGSNAIALNPSTSIGYLRFFHPIFSIVAVGTFLVYMVWCICSHYINRVRERHLVHVQATQLTLYRENTKANPVLGKFNLCVIVPPSK